MDTYSSVWEGPKRKIGIFNPENSLVQIGWWYEPQKLFVAITDEKIPIVGSMSPVYCEIGDD